MWLLSDYGHDLDFGGELPYRISCQKERQRLSKLGLKIMKKMKISEGSTVAENLKALGKKYKYVCRWVSSDD